MSRAIHQPINQVRLTNVATVRYNVAGQRFEIACYRNKVLDYRAGLETDLSEVLQTDRIFTNVSKGQFAADADLHAAFGDHVTEEQICRIILEKGKSVQVSDLERAQQYENRLSQIADWVARNCVHAHTQRPYTASQIKHALQHGSSGSSSVGMTKKGGSDSTGADAGTTTVGSYQIQPHKAVKRQYLDAVKFLKQILPLERAKMELALILPSNDVERMQFALQKMDSYAMVEKSTLSGHQDLDTQQEPAHSDTVVLVIQVDPSHYRDLLHVTKEFPGSRMEIRQQVVMETASQLEGKDQGFEGAHTDSVTNIAAYPFVHDDILVEGGDDDDEDDSSQHGTNDDDDDDDVGEDDKPLKQHIQAIRKQVKKIQTGNDDESDDSDIALNHTRSSQHKSSKKKKKQNKIQRQQMQPVPDDEAGQEQYRSDTAKLILETTRQSNLATELDNEIDSHDDQQGYDVADRSSVDPRREINNDSDEDEDPLATTGNLRKKQLKAQKKKQKKKQMKQQEQSNSSDDSDQDASGDIVAQNVTPSIQKMKKKSSKGEFSKKASTTVRADQPIDGFDPLSSNASTVADVTSQANNKYLHPNENTKRCTTCGGHFSSSADYRQHFRSDWHKFNQQLKLKNIPPVSEQEFLLCDAESLVGSKSNKDPNRDLLML